MLSRLRGKGAAATAAAILMGAVLVAGFAFPEPGGMDAGWADGEWRADLPLWELTNDGTTVYLLGSVHMLRPEAYPLDDALYDAFDAAEVVAFELDYAEAESAAPLMMARGLFDDGRTLRETLPAATHSELDRRVTELGLPIEGLEPMKPWLVALTLTTLVVQQAGFRPELGIDRHFYDRAIAEGKRVVALETVEEQVDVFDGLGSGAQAAFLQSTLAEIDDAAARLDEMTALWESGDTDRLADFLRESMEGQDELIERIFHERNRNWVPRIEELLEADQDALVVVGLGHLVGDGSVVELLRALGYEVEQVATAVS